MKTIIGNVTDIDDDDKRGRTVMHDAAWRGHTDVLRFLIENKASVSRTDHHNRTPLFFACLGRSEEAAHFLLDKMIEQGLSIEDINKRTIRGRTPLRQAASKGFTELVQAFLDKIDSLDVVNAVDTLKGRGRNALHCAAYRGKSAVVAALLKKGADSTIKDSNDKTALQICHEEWAIQETKDFEDTVSLLIAHDPAAAARDSLLMTTAAVIGSRRILEELHKVEADLDKIDR
jgi:ankyrin repeat protein